MTRRFETRIRCLTASLGLLVLATGPALAERALTTPTGEVYAEHVLPGASRLTGPAGTIRLGDDCAAEIAGRGRGVWFWTGEGTTIRVGAYDLRLTDLPLLSMTACVG